MTTAPSLAILTPSYAGDFQRCRLLCESLDVMASDPLMHYLLVADHDEQQFRPLAGPRRRVITDSELLPRWLKAVRRPFDAQRRHIWISTDLRQPVRPLSGWHVQQLRKLSAARLVDEDILVMADSDSVFVRPVSASSFWRNGRARLYRKQEAIPPVGRDAAANAHWSRHVAWTRHAAAVLDLPLPRFPADDFINNLVSWRKDRALELISHIETVSGRPLVAALGRATTFSEYQIYGAFVSQGCPDSGHFDSPDALSHTYWSGAALNPERARDFVNDLGSEQIAVCVQSFTGTPVEVMRGLIQGAGRG